MRAAHLTGAVLAALLAGAATAHAASDLRLIEAVRAGDAAAVRQLLAKKADVNAKQPDGATALHWAAERDRTDLVDALLRAGALPDAVNDYGVTPIMLAAANGSDAAIERLIAGGADANAALPTGETVLMTAARTGKLAAVRALVAHGADVNAKEKVKGQTALMWSIWQGHDDVTLALVEAGADVKAASAAGSTPMLFAVREGNLPILRLLFDRGAADPNQAGGDNFPALHIAIMRGHVEMAKFLLDRGADPNSSKPGFTVLHWVAGTWESGHAHDYIFNETAVNRVHEWSVLAGIPSVPQKHDLIRTLVAKGANVNAVMEKAPPRFGHSLFKTGLLRGATPFYLASVTSDIPTMKLLLELGADPKIHAADNNSPIIMAAGLGRVEQESRVPEERAIEAVKLLLSLGANINEANAAGNTSLHAATMAGLEHVVRFLAEHGAAINAKNKAGATPLKLSRGFEDMFLLYMRPKAAAVLETFGATE
ncbi:MAG: ankyrin repeat domain-containing protein [Vicinamibacterales bacterium]